MSTKRLVTSIIAMMTVLSPALSMAFDKTKYVYLMNNKTKKEEFSKERVNEAFVRAFQAQKPVVLFVHGRGDEPTKSLEGTGVVLSTMAYLRIGGGSTGLAVRKLQETYGVTVILFSWNSVRSYAGLDFINLTDRSKPLTHATNQGGGGDRLGTVIDSLSTLPPTRPPLVLLAHSMGSWVIKDYIEKRKMFPKGLFSNLILSSSDVDNVHVSWIEDLAKTANVYVTTNEKDWTLDRVKIDSLRKSAPVGLQLGASSAQNAHYVKIAMEAHEVFYRSNWEGNKTVCRFFYEVLGGKRATLTLKGGSGNVYFLPAVKPSDIPENCNKTYEVGLEDDDL